MSALAHALAEEGRPDDIFTQVARIQSERDAARAQVTALQEANLRSGRVPVAQLMPGEAFQAWQASRGNIVLTDDYVPVENLLAPLYLESR